MNILLAAATEGEISLFRSIYNQKPTRFAAKVTFLITGVGGIATAFALTHTLAGQSYDLVLQAGVGGSFDRLIALGEVVSVTRDRYGDLGAEDHEVQLDIFDMGLIDANLHPHSGGVLHTPLSPFIGLQQLRQVSGLTVNMVSGNERTIARRTARYGCSVESMEGAALHYVCLQLGAPFAQVRAISNYIIPRDKSQWKMKEAVTNLNEWLVAFLEHVE